MEMSEKMKQALLGADDEGRVVGHHSTINGLLIRRLCRDVDPEYHGQVGATLTELGQMERQRLRILAGTSAPVGLPSQGELLKPGQATALLNVHPHTLISWVEVGRLTCIRTVGGHYRYRADEIRAILTGAAEAVTDLE